MSDKTPRYSADSISLVPPSKEHAEQVMAIKAEMLQNKDSLDGWAGLQKVDTYDEWLDFETRYKAEGLVPSQVYLAIRDGDQKVVGVIDYRYPLNEALIIHGGNIVYSVRPSERKKGYASQILAQVLPICRASGEKEVLLTCKDGNIASQKVIIKNGGIEEKELISIDESQKVPGFKRFWIKL